VGPPRRDVRHVELHVVVEPNSESHARRPTTRAWAIIRRANRAHRLSSHAPAGSTTATPTEWTVSAHSTHHMSGTSWPMPADPQQGLQRVLASGVPQVATDQPGAAPGQIQSAGNADELLGGSIESGPQG
jgi:hypothetical protein